MRLIRRCDPCGSDWKEKIKELWEKYQGCVRGVKAGSITAYPDGDGIADIDGAVTDAIAQQMPTMLAGYVTDAELAQTLESYPTNGDLAQTLEDYATTNQLYSKQDRLITGINLKSVNGKSLLGAGDILIRGTLPDTEDASEGDALVINSEGIPEWGTVDAGLKLHRYTTMGEVAQAMRDNPNGLFICTKGAALRIWITSFNDTGASCYADFGYIAPASLGTYSTGFELIGKPVPFTIRYNETGININVTNNRMKIKGQTTNNSLEITTDTISSTITCENIVGIY